MRSVKLCALLSVLFAAVTAQAAAPPKIARRPPGTIAFTTEPGKVHTMNGTTTYSSIQITNGTISAITNGPVPNPTKLPPGAAIYPGFIDSHSHAISLLSAQATNSTGVPYWKSLANVNVMQLPACAVVNRASVLGSTKCFIPVTTQDDVVAVLKTATPRAGWILGWNYEPSRLTCVISGVPKYGFQCPNFENQNQQPVLQTMNDINSTVPMLVTSESGHIAYVNSKALKALNICGGASNTPDLPNCHPPVINPTNEIALAKTGQLDEDLALYAISQVEGVLAADYASPAKTTAEKNAKILDFYAKQIDSALALYSALGYTTVQEGAASYQLVDIYMLAVAAMAAQTPPRYLPATMALLEYDMTTPQDFAGSVTRAANFQKTMAAYRYDMFMAGMKVYADGSTQGYTGDMSPGMYQNLFKPFTDPAIFTQPYHGLPDYDQNAVASSANAAHSGNLPLWVHTNGPEAQNNVVSALLEKPSDTLRDVIVHLAMPTKQQVDILPTDKIGVTFLVNDFYYFYQPLCEQVLTPDTTANLYPAAWARQHGLHVGLHSDVSVTPPSPLFGMWVATTRSTQKAWLPPLSSTCNAVGANQTIGLFQALQAYTSDAAWLYGRDTTTPTTGPGRGSLQPGFAGDLVILSADPLAPGADLSKIYVLYTVHNGNIVYPAGGGGWAKQGPAWPQ
jgi:predicted amidohydrolase YtcJ